MKTLPYKKYRIIPSEEFCPAERSLHARIVESIQSHIPMEQTGIPVFQDEPNKPTDNMRPDPAFGIRDIFDRAEMTMDQIGSAVDQERLSREMTAKANVQPTAEGAQHTEQSEVKD